MRKLTRSSPPIKALNVRIGKTIRLRRKLLGLTQIELADRAGISFQGIQKWECGSIALSAAQLVFLAEALETTPSRLLPSPPTKDTQTCQPSPTSNPQSKP